MKPTWDEWPEARDDRLGLFDAVLMVLTPFLALIVIGVLGFIVVGALVYLDYLGAFDRRS
jgi:hypothetical protein